MGKRKSSDNNDERLYISTPVIGLEFFAALVAIGTGGNLSLQLTSSFVGFQFLGITLMLIGVALLILACNNFLLFRNPGLSVTKSMFGSVPLILVMIAFGIFAFAVSCNGGGKSVHGRSYKEYRVESYSKWMQNKVNHNWDTYYRKAVVQNKDRVCAKSNVDDQFKSNPAFQSGCCEPPKDCSFEVLVKKTKNETTYSNDDCNRWDDEPNTLCFDCESCKAGLLQDITSHWFWVGIWLIFAGLFIVLLLVFANVVGGIQFMSSSQDYTPLA